MYSFSISPPNDPQLVVCTMLASLSRFFRRTPKHSRLPQIDTESLDSDTLLHGSTTSLTLKKFPFPNVEYQVAFKTLVICSVVYLSIGFWIAHSVHEADFVTDADKFCINHVNQYCQLSR
jgi:hypothetical protein